MHPNHQSNFQLNHKNDKINRYGGHKSLSIFTVGSSKIFIALNILAMETHLIEASQNSRILRATQIQQIGIGVQEFEF